ncbi:hypothetical protein [Nocardia arizonensis]|uniref:hypothetical protein n=1 Tax=Nocardia arizonensis TaxID=1141647 RepID=UPI0012E18E10|nr:hypothetical protein [Nocardia arizonensis]
MTISTRHDPDSAAPLGIPAILLAVTMLITPLPMVDKFSTWCADYGWLVYAALALFLVGALLLLRWGMVVRRADSGS